MNDQIIDQAMARSLHVDACRDHPLVAWIVMQNPPDYANKLTARLATDTPSPYVLVANTLAEIHAQLPPTLERTGQQPNDLPEVVEIWFSRQGVPRNP